jgi:flavodoxin
MRTIIVYHSHSGHTRALAECVRDGSGGDLFEVKPQTPYGPISVYSRGGRRAVKGEVDAIKPGVIDVSSYDCIVIGTPVWGGHPTPVINGAVAALQGAAGKSAVLFATCGSGSGATLPALRAALAARGVNVVGEFSFGRRELGDAARIGALVEAIRGRELA